MKKRRPKDIIESEKSPHLEHVYIKFPGQEIVPITKRSTTKSVNIDIKKVIKLWEENKYRKYTGIHTHPEEEFLPSSKDIEALLEDDSAKAKVIVPLINNNKNIAGFFYLRKTKKTPSYRDIPNKRFSSFKDLRRLFYPGRSKEFSKELNEYKSVVMNPSKSFQDINQKLREIADKYHLQYRFVPAKESASVKESGIDFDYLKETFRSKKNLEDKTLISMIIIGFTSSLFFLSINITGHIISGLNQNISNQIGIILFILGLICSLIYFKKRRLE